MDIKRRLLLVLFLTVCISASVAGRDVIGYGNITNDWLNETFSDCRVTSVSESGITIVDPDGLEAGVIRDCREGYCSVYFVANFDVRENRTIDPNHQMNWLNFGDKLTQWDYITAGDGHSFRGLVQAVLNYPILTERNISEQEIRAAYTLFKRNIRGAFVIDDLFYYCQGPFIAINTTVAEKLYPNYDMPWNTTLDQW